MRVLGMVKHGCSKIEDSPVLQYEIFNGKEGKCVLCHQI